MYISVTLLVIQHSIPLDFIAKSFFSEVSSNRLTVFDSFRLSAWKLLMGCTSINVNVLHCTISGYPDTWQAYFYNSTAKPLLGVFKNRV